MVEIINATPHSVTDVETGTAYPASGITVRVREVCTTLPDELQRIPGVTLREHTLLSEVEGLPDEKEGVFYIVSMLVRQACPGRRDLISPGELVRDDSGQITGCRGFFAAK